MNARRGGDALNLEGRFMAEYKEVGPGVLTGLLIQPRLVETHSFHGFVTGKICMADTTASALAVLNKIEFVTTGSTPRIRPS